MRLDSQLAFIPIGGNLVFTASSTATPSTNTIDLLGTGVGTAPANIIGNATVFGTDMGIGFFRPEIDIASGSAAFSGTSINVALQGAIDSGASGGYQPGTWITFGETGVITLANTAIGANTTFARLPWLPAWPAGTLPRYLRLLFTPVSLTGTVAFAVVTTGRDDQANRYAWKNFKVA